MALLSRRCLLGSLALALLWGCDRTPPEPAKTAPSSTTPPAESARLEETDTSYRFRTTGRVVAVGDLHGDMDATRRALRTAGVIDDKDAWSGGSTVLVQTGDVLDRGDDERAILDLFDRLGDEAKKAGGAVYALHGNHEIMNVAGDLRYVTRGGFTTFENVTSPPNPRLGERFEQHERARGLAFAPGGPYALRLARLDTVVMVNDTLFVHGGVLSKHIRYGLGKLNREVKAWMRGDRPNPPPIMDGEDAPTWNRRYSSPDVDARDCRVLATALDHVGAKRMVVGHTPQKGGITSACNDRVWRIDIGLASHYGSARAQVLAIDGDKLSVLREQRDSP